MGIRSGAAVAGAADLHLFQQLAHGTVVHEPDGLCGLCGREKSLTILVTHLPYALGSVHPRCFCAVLVMLVHAPAQMSYFTSNTP